MDEQLIIDVWETFKDYIPEKSRATAADQYVDFLLDKDVDIETLEGLLGYDPNLDEAVQAILDENEESDSEEEDSYDSWHDEEDY